MAGRRVFLAVCFSLFLAASALAGTPAPDREVRATGLGDDPRAALLDAKRGAVEQVAGAMVVSETEVENFTVNKDEVVSRTLGSIKSYQVLSQKETPDGLTETTILAVVSADAVTRELNALKILFQAMDKPRVMVLVSEKIGGESTSTFQTRLIGKLMEMGFNMVDPAVTSRLLSMNSDLARRALDGDRAAAVEVGTRNGAEVILIGKALVSEGGTVYDMKSGQADVSLTAISCATGKILASSNAHGAAVHVNYESAGAGAVKKAADQIMAPSREDGTVPAFFDKLVASWQDMALNGAPVALSVANVNDFRTYMDIQKLLGGISGAVEVTGRGFTRPECRFEVVFRGPAEKLAMALDGKALASGRTLMVTGMTAGSVAAEVK